jgi:hypothetical protein
MRRKFVAMVTVMRVIYRNCLQITFLLTGLNRNEPQRHIGVCNTWSLALNLRIPTPARNASNASYPSMTPVNVLGPQPAYLDADTTVRSGTKSRAWQELLWAQVCDYCEKTTLHGYRYLTEPGRHWVER